MTEWTVNNKLNEWYQKRYHIKLPKQYITKALLYFTASYSPFELFATGSTGLWLDPSDVANLAWRRNLLTYSEQFGNAIWLTNANMSKGAAQTDPLGGNTAIRISATGTNADFYQVVTVPAGTYVNSIWVRRVTGSGTVNLNTPGNSGVAISLTSSWQRFTVSSSAAGGGAYIAIRITTSGDAVDVAFAQFEAGTVATDYQRISDVNTEVIERFPSATMYQDAAGTTAVTTPGQPVGLRLDKSKGLALGAELVANGDFSSGTTGWAATNATLSVVSGQLRVVKDSAATFCIARVEITGLTVGRTYRVLGTFATISLATGTQIWVGTAGGAQDLNLNRNSTTAGSVSAAFVAGAATRQVEFVMTGATGTASVMDIDNISVKELPGNHAVQSVLASRPTYGIEPAGGRRNLLLATDTLATQSLTVTAVAHTLAFTGTGTVTLSGASIAGPLIGTGASDRVSLTFTPTAASLTLTVVGSVTLGQLELGSSVTAYQKVVTAYDITESGVATTHYVQYDGSDDSMSTAAIDFTATDKMSVFAGVRKTTNGNNSCIVELSAVASSNSGAFYILTGRNVSGPAPAYTALSRGTAFVSLDTADLYDAPISNLLTLLSDISGDTAKLRVNGAQVAQSTGDQGTGNFGNYPLYLGRRGGASLSFSGRDYGIVVVGKATTATEITSTENWLAAKTGFYAPVITGVPTIGVS